jgi:elongation factor Ts
MKSVQLIQQLRKLTGSPIGHCKTAIEQSQGDLALAQEWLRAKGISQASKKFANLVSVGLVAARVEDNNAFMLETLCETDFVARSEVFQQLVSACVLSAPPSLTLEELPTIALRRPLDLSLQTQTVQEARVHTISKLQENIEFRRLTYLLGSPTSVVAAYVHNALSPGLGSSACIVKLTADKPVEAHRDFLQELGCKLSMHIIAAKPLYLNKAQVPATEVDKETAAVQEQLGEQLKSKPEKVQAAMVKGRLDKYFENVVLEEQTFMIDDEDLTVKALLLKAAQHIQAKLQVEEFVAYHCGEALP